MSTPLRPEPSAERAPVTDESLLALHEKMLGKQPDGKAHYGLPPLYLLFFASALILFGGLYLGLLSGHFHPLVYNESGQPPKAGVEAAVVIDPLVLGKNVYGQVCVTCHQPTGLGLPPAFPPLVGSEWVAGSEERLIRILLYGLQGPIKVKGTEFNGVMPAVGPGSGYNLSPAKVAAALTFVRKEWAGIAVPVSAAKVVEIRGKEGSRAPMTVPELEKIP